MYNTTNIPKATKRVNISGDTPPDIWMSMLDSRGKLQKFNISTKTKILKYIPSSDTWYICGEYADLLRSQNYLNR